MINGNINVNIDVNISKLQMLFMILISVIFLSNLPAWLVYFKFRKFIKKNKKEDY